MPHRVVFTASAKQDVREARDWYDRAGLDLGTAFVKDVLSATDRIASDPWHFADVPPNGVGTFVSSTLTVQLPTSRPNMSHIQKTEPRAKRKLVYGVYGAKCSAQRSSRPPRVRSPLGLRAIYRGGKDFSEFGFARTRSG